MLKMEVMLVTSAALLAKKLVEHILMRETTMGIWILTLSLTLETFLTMLVVYVLLFRVT